MEKLFENEQFALLSTGHDYDFVGIIETKTDEPLTFFFSEEISDDSDDWESRVDENQTRLLDMQQGLREYEEGTDDPDDDEEQLEAERLGATSYLRTRDDKSTGFLSDPTERGQFLAIIKHYCPEKLDCLTWVENGQSIM